MPVSEQRHLFPGPCSLQRHPSPANVTSDPNQHHLTNDPRHPRAGATSLRPLNVTLAVVNPQRSRRQRDPPSSEVLFAAHNNRDSRRSFSVCIRTLRCVAAIVRARASTSTINHDRSSIPIRVPVGTGNPDPTVRLSASQGRSGPPGNDPRTNPGAEKGVGLTSPISPCRALRSRSFIQWRVEAPRRASSPPRAPG